LAALTHDSDLILDFLCAMDAPIVKHRCDAVKDVKKLFEFSGKIKHEKYRTTQYSTLRRHRHRLDFIMA
jgi:hypothetical protein